ncbi:MAG: UDP-N-acetylmuramoyl-tripeptide--D-alanyl-D-alanine ligase [Magnetococcales bacterium]|nr:UDP-N-acetylmuramoyl-tripeptide--D-alanyl-D-alanine ligase [Magnetococcales bacterium]
MIFDATFIKEALNPTLTGDHSGQQNIPFTGLSIDTRTLKPGEIYAALRGDRLDGHRFIPHAIEAGCSAIIAERQPDQPVDIPVFLVPDTLDALSRLGHAWRERIAPRVIAITGSSGKTTVKEMVTACLKQRYKTHATQGNFNNHIGVPLTLLNMPTETEVLVVEMGMSAAGEIDHLTKLARPDIGVVTNIMPAHMAAFESLEDIARAKSELPAALPDDGIAILPARDRFADLLEMVSQAPIRWFDVKPRDDSRNPADQIVLIGTPVLENGRFCFSMQRQDKILPISLSYPGSHMVANALAAAEVGFQMDLTAQEIIDGLSDFKLPAGRGEMHSCLGGWTVVDDTYNANPGSMRSALRLLDRYLTPSGSGRRIAILGDMLELGEEEDKRHARLTNVIQDSRIQGLFTAGKCMAALHHEAQNLPGLITGHHDDPAQWLDGSLLKQLQPGDVILVKGSRGMRMERIVEALRARKA